MSSTRKGAQANLWFDPFSLVEIKTISPLRDSRHVKVKASGNFGYLVIVKIDADFRIDAKLIKRSRLGTPENRYFTVSWEQHRSEPPPVPDP